MSNAKDANQAAERTAMLPVPILFRCRVMHDRREGVRHRFDYPWWLWLVDLDALPRPPWPLSLLLRFRARDHLGDPGLSIRANVGNYLALNGVDVTGGRVLMLAQARALGYVFDPLTVFWCHDRAGRLAAIIAEVRNTFGERHCYLLTPDDSGRSETPKKFYVSPLFTVDGRYLMRFRLSETRVSVTFVLRRPAGQWSAADGGEHTALTATLHGDAVRTGFGRLRTLLAHPFASYRTIALIHYQSWRLRRAGLPVRRRRLHRPQPGIGPSPTSGRGGPR